MGALWQSVNVFSGHVHNVHHLHRGGWLRVHNAGSISALDDPVPHAPLDWIMRPCRAAIKGRRLSQRES
jgi:hypothetical protein